MKAIETKFFGPSNIKGARIKAYDMDNNNIMIPYPYELSGENVHRKAAEALIQKMGWGRPGDQLIGGETKTGYVFLIVRA